MSAVTTLPWGRELTVEDLDSIPDDGHRYELIDGTLIVTPAPSKGHQRVLRGLAFALGPLVPEGHELLWAPTDVRTSRRTNLQPDLLVVTLEDADTERVSVAPLLAAEVLSPSTRHVDVGLKRSKYEALGTPSYWVVDPDALTNTVWELVPGRYVEAGHAEGDSPLVLERPFPVRIVPAELVP
jgi:Uma2 family endonuclease